VAPSTVNAHWDSGLVAAKNGFFLRRGTVNVRPARLGIRTQRQFGMRAMFKKAEKL